MSELALTTATWTIKDSMDWAQPVQFTDESDVPYDLTGSTFRMDIKVSAADPGAVLSLTSANGGILSTDLANGTITLVVGDFALDPGSYVADLIRITGATREWMMDVAVEVLQGVTGP